MAENHLVQSCDFHRDTSALLMGRLWGVLACAGLVGSCFWISKTLPNKKKLLSNLKHFTQVVVNYLITWLKFLEIPTKLLTRTSYLLASSLLFCLLFSTPRKLTDTAFREQNCIETGGRNVNKKGRGDPVSC